MKTTYDHALSFVSCKKHTFKIGFSLKKITVQTNGLFYITRGSAVVSINGVKHHIEPGTSILLDSNATIEIGATIMNEIHFYYLKYRNIPASNLDETSSFNMISLQIIAQARVISLLEKISEKVSDDPYISWLRKQSLLYELLYVISKNKAIQEKNKNSPIKLTIDYMIKHSEEQLAISDLARLAFMTQSSFCRAFKRETGLTPSGYLRNLRVAQAKDMLKTSSYSIKDVARTVGIADELYFSRLFKNSEGISPTIYRKKYEPRIAIFSDLFLQDHLLALGIKPVAAPCFPTECPTETGFPKYLENQLQGTKRLNAEIPLDLQDGLTMEPHFLLKLNDRNNNDNNNEVLIHTDTKIIHFDRFLNWKDYQRFIAKVVGREVLAENVIKDIGKVEQMAKDKLKKITRNGKWTIMRILKDRILIHGVTGHPISDLIYEGLGFQCDDRLNYSSCRNYSVDEMVELNPERIIILWSEQESLNDLFENPLWLELQAVKKNHIYIPESFAWDPWGPSGRRYIINECVKYFQARYL